jgi:hypothetical protein
MKHKSLRFRIDQARREFRVWLYDIDRRMRGICNDAPWAMGPTSRGGYSHWRCQLRRGHETLHRANNYTWGDSTDERTTYDPVPVPIPSPGAWREPDVPNYARSRRQRIQSDAFLAERYGVLLSSRAGGDS